MVTNQGREPITEEIEGAEGFKTQEMLLNMGPQHPSTHGVLRLHCSPTLSSLYSLKIWSAYLLLVSDLNSFWLASFYAYTLLAFHVLTFQAVAENSPPPPRSPRLHLPDNLQTSGQM